MVAILAFQVKILAILDLQVTPMLPSKFQVNWPFSSEEKNRFSMAGGGHLGFPIKTILAIFDVQVSLMLLTEFQVNWPFGSGEEAKKQIFKTVILDFRSEQF